MIVKDEAEVIARCLRSTMPHINSWCIVDTGSSDNTEEIVLRTLQGIPGSFHKRPWVDFATNRNEAWELALQHNPAYLMFIDADEELVVDGSIPQLSLDAYLISVHYMGELNNRFWMVRSDYPHRWQGVIHEDIPAHGQIGKVLGTLIVSHTDGGRSKDIPAKRAHDISILRQMHEAEPDNPRHVYYLGVTLLMDGQTEEGLRLFKVRSTMGGNEQELFKVRAVLNHYQEQGVLP